MLDEHRDDGRHVERGRQQVIGERGVAHVSIAKLNFLHHRKAETLRDPALDLADHRDRVDRLADVLRGRDLNDLHQAGVDIDVDHRAVRGEQERDVALILRLRIARLGVAMAVCDRPIDRLVEKGGQIVG